MSKWRPARACTYVIPDIHGHYDCLKSICKRILPLRDQDKIIFLGDYIDRGPDSAKVLDYIISLHDKYEERIIPLIGNHEWLLLAGLGLVSHNWEKHLDSPFSIWMREGGVKTIESYAKDTSLDLTDIITLKPDRIKDIITESHIEFMLNNLYLFYEDSKYIFVHGGCDPTQTLDSSWMETFIWDRSLYQLAKNFAASGRELPWDKTVVCGHSANGPWINEKLMMLDCSNSKKLLVVELNSMEAFAAGRGNVRLERIKLVNGDNKIKNKVKPMFRRVK